MLISSIYLSENWTIDNAYFRNNYANLIFSNDNALLRQARQTVFINIQSITCFTLMVFVIHVQRTLEPDTDLSERLKVVKVGRCLLTGKPWRRVFLVGPEVFSFPKKGKSSGQFI